MINVGLNDTALFMIHKSFNMNQSRSLEVLPYDNSIKVPLFVTEKLQMIQTTFAAKNNSTY